MSTKQLILGTAGIYAAYLTLSLVNERLYTHQYVNIKVQLAGQFKTDKFTFPDLMVLVSSVFCTIFALIRSKLMKDHQNPIPYKQYFVLGILYTINLLAATYALLYISYPVRVVSDKCGYLTAVIVGVYFSRVKKQGLKLQPKKVIIAILITVGAIMFAVMKDQEASKKWQAVYDPNTMWIGYLLMLISITAQAFFTDSQAYCKVAYKPSINHLMYTVNLMTALICVVNLFISGKALDSIYFCFDHPFVVFDITLIGLLQVLGQLSIYFVVLNFKQHMFPLISTTRKVFTVLLSIFIFNHKMNLYQWVALIMVFGGMGYQLFDQLYSQATGKIKIIKKSSSKSEVNKEQKSSQASQLKQKEKKTQIHLQMQSDDYLESQKKLQQSQVKKEPEITSLQELQQRKEQQNKLQQNTINNISQKVQSIQKKDDVTVCQNEQEKEEEVLRDQKDKNHSKVD